MNEILEAGTLEDGLCGGGLNLGTFVTWSDVPTYKGAPDLIQYQARTAHEDGHWARWLGTTLGVSLTSMRYASQRLIRDTLSAQTHADREKLFDLRQAGRPIFSLAEPPALPGMELEWQLWTDLHVGYSALYDSERLEGFGWDVGEAVASALTDALYWELPLHDRPRGNFRSLISPVDIHFIRFGEFGLTSRALFEAMGLVDELLSWGVPGKEDALGARFEAHYYQMLGTSYGTPHRVFAGLRDDSRRSPVEEAITVACLADFALNPPLSPYVDRAMSESLRWGDIFPPIRFLRACQAMRSEELLPSDPNDDDIRSYMARLSGALHLMNPLEYSSLDLGLDDPRLEKDFSFESPEIGPNDHGRMKGDYIALLDWAARQLWQLRLSDPGLLLLHGQRILRPERRKKAGLLIFEDGAGWYTAPFERTLEGTGFSDYLGSEVATQFMMSLGLYLSMHQLACRTGPFDLTELPDIVGMRDRWEEVRQAVNAIMQYPIW